MARGEGDQQLLSRRQVLSEPKWRRRCSRTSHERLPTGALAFLFLIGTQIGEAFLEVGREIGRVCGDVDGSLKSRLATEPPAKFLLRSRHIASFADDRHSGMSPALRDRQRLPKKSSNLCPTP
jgi:hypothetical protein